MKDLNNKSIIIIIYFIYLFIFLVDLKVMKEPKNLFIGRCSKDDKLLHSENIILLNDKKGQVNATIAVSYFNIVHQSIYLFIFIDRIRMILQINKMFYLFMPKIITDKFCNYEFS